MKVFLTLVIFLLGSQAIFAQENTTIITCGPLRVPREKVEEAFKIVSDKLEECHMNNLDCANYHWLKGEAGSEGISTLTNGQIDGFVSLYEIAHQLDVALYCDKLATEHPGETGGVIEF